MKKVLEPRGSLGFPARQWRLGTVNKFLQKLAATGSRAQRAGSGRPRTERTIDNVKAVEDLALSEEDQPGTSLSDRELAKAVGISGSSVWRIVREDLQLKVFKRVAATELNAATQAKRLSRAKDLLRRFKSQDVKKICFSDEKIFSVSAPISLQNDRVRGRVAKKTELPAANLIRERQKSRASVMVSLGVTADHKTSVIFVPPGVKINSMEYQNVILEPLLAYESHGVRFRIPARRSSIAHFKVDPALSCREAAANYRTFDVATVQFGFESARLLRLAGTGSVSVPWWANQGCGAPRRQNRLCCGTSWSSLDQEGDQLLAASS